MSSDRRKSRHLYTVCSKDSLQRFCREGGYGVWQVWRGNGVSWFRRNEFRLHPSHRFRGGPLPLTVPRVARRPLRPLAKPSPCSSLPFCHRFRKYADGEMERRARKCRETVADPHSHDGGLPHFHRKSAPVEIIISFPAVPPHRYFPSA